MEIEAVPSPAFTIRVTRKEMLTLGIILGKLSKHQVGQMPGADVGTYDAIYKAISTALRAD